MRWGLCSSGRSKHQCKSNAVLIKNLVLPRAESYTCKHSWWRLTLPLGILESNPSFSPPLYFILFFSLGIKWLEECYPSSSGKNVLLLFKRAPPIQGGLLRCLAFYSHVTQLLFLCPSHRLL